MRLSDRRMRTLQRLAPDAMMRCVCAMCGRCRGWHVSASGRRRAPALTPGIPVVCAARPRVACAAVARPVRRSRSTSLAMSTADSSRGFDVSLGSGVLGSETMVL